MRWIDTSLLLSIGGEHEPQYDVRFTGIYHGARRDPREPASFEVYEVQVHLGGPSGNGWAPFPREFLTPELYAALERIGLAEEQAAIARDRRIAADQALDQPAAANDRNTSSRSSAA